MSSKRKKREAPGREEQDKHEEAGSRKIEIESGDKANDEPDKKVPEADVEQKSGEEKVREKGKANVSVEELERFEKRSQDAEQYYDQLLRLKAEFENYRKRINRDREEFAKFAVEDLIRDLLTVIDNLEHALSASEKTKDFKILHEGVEMTRKDALRILKQWGLEEVKARGEMFDPEKHEAVMHVDSDEEEGKIIEEMRKGYSLHGKLMRPTLVKVARRIKDGKESGKSNRN